jgi:hypothetical protein
MIGFYNTLRERIHFKLYECGQAVQAGLIRALATAAVTDAENLKVGGDSSGSSNFFYSANINILESEWCVGCCL